MPGPGRKNTIECDSSKVEVAVGGEKKNFCFFQKNSISFNAALATCVRPCAARRAPPLAVGWLVSGYSVFPCEPETFSFLDPACDRFFARGGEKKQQTMPVFSNSPTNMSAFLFKQPREATSKCQVTRMRKSWGIGAGSGSNMLLLRTRIRWYFFIY